MLNHDQLAAPLFEHSDVPCSNLGRIPKTNFVLFEIDSFWKLSQLSKYTCDYSTKKNTQGKKFCLFICTAIRLERGTSDPPVIHVHNDSYWSHVSSSHFTTVEMNAIERTLNNSCSQSLACKRDPQHFKSIFSKKFSSFEFNWYQTSICWNMSILHYRGTNHPKIEGSGQISFFLSFVGEGPKPFSVINPSP